jgi:hypothetical protein
MTPSPASPSSSFPSGRVLSSTSEPSVSSSSFPSLVSLRSALHLAHVCTRSTAVRSPLFSHSAASLFPHASSSPTVFPLGARHARWPPALSRPSMSSVGSGRHPIRRSGAQCHRSPVCPRSDPTGATARWARLAHRSAGVGGRARMRVALGSGAALS